VTTPKTDTSAPESSLDELTLLRQIVADVSECVKVLDIDAHLLSMNAGGMRIMEIDNFDACAFAFWPDFWPLDVRPHVDAAVQAARAGQSATFTGFCPTLKGTGKWWEVTVSPLCDASGRVVQLLSISRDITPHKQAEEAARREAALLDAMNAQLEQRVAERTAELTARTRALEAFASVTRDLTTKADPYALVRRALEVLLPILGNGYGTFYEPEDGVWRTRVLVGERHDDGLDQRMDTGVPFERARSLHDPWVTRQPLFQDAYPPGTDAEPGLARHVNAVASLPVLVDDEPVGVMAFGMFDRHVWSPTDRAVLETVVRSLGLAIAGARGVAQLAERTRELQHANEELARERVFLKVVLESLAEGVVACDPEGNLTLFNDATRSFHGMDAEPVPPQEWSRHYDLFESDGVTPLATTRIPLYRALQGERVHDAEMVIAPKQGAARWIVANGRPIYSDGGKALGAVVAMHDITERKKAEEQLRRSNEELRRSNRELERFAYIASHDLQAPIRAIASFAEVIERRYGALLDEKGRVYLRQIVGNGHHMKRLVDDLLAFSRLHTQQRPLQPADSGAILADVLRRLSGEIEAAHADITHDTLPMVLADVGQLDTLWQNLIQNALKYHRPGVPPRVHVHVEREGRSWRFDVHDNGIGIDEAYFGRIFEIFQRLHTREQYEGTGIGLAVCKKIIDRHDGTLSVRSRVGEGSTFSFTLPAI